MEIDLDGRARQSADRQLFYPTTCTGWVVGGHGGTTYSRLKPVVLYTTDGGKSWENVLQNSGIDFPTGEWGWKIQFLTPQIGFVSLENDAAGAMLKTVGRRQDLEAHRDQRSAEERRA